MNHFDKPRRSRAGCVIKLAAAVVVSLISGLYVGSNLMRANSYDKGSEAKTNLGALFTSQRSYFGEHGTYASGNNCFDLVGWHPEGETRYSYYCADSVIACNRPNCADCGGAQALGFEPASSRRGFTIYAIGNIDRDSDCDVWSFNDAMALHRERKDFDDNWWDRWPMR